MRSRYTSNPVNAAVPTAGNPGNTGDGHIMAWAVGADNTNMESAGSPSGLYMLPNAPRGTGISNYVMEAGAIIVNKDGQRFQNEIGSIGGGDIYEQPDKVAFVVFDSVAATTDIVPEGAPTGRGPWICTCRYLDHWREYPGSVKEADTVEELAAELGVSGSGLTETVNKYNSYVATGQDPDFERPDLGPGIKEPPFFGLGPGIPMITGAGGTLICNERLQVLDVFGEPIPRLYSAGSMAKSGSTSGHGISLQWACASGRKSGEFAASESPIEL